ncbi:MAG: SMP-30/gluconolactonase/LRE family protein, partial [Planctomycetota bacterium]
AIYFDRVVGELASNVQNRHNLNSLGKRLCRSIVLLLLMVNAQKGRAHDILEEGSRVASVSQVAFTEGPAWHPNGSVFFTDVENNRIMWRDPASKTRIYRTPSGRANGLVFDLEGRLLACEGGKEGGNRRVTRTELDGSIAVLIDRFEGKRFNSPNDITVDSKGFIFFTDPRYGDRSDMELFDAKGKAIEGVYCIAPDGEVTRILTHEVERPNGLAISPDDKFLFIADNANHAAARKLWRFQLDKNRQVIANTQKLLFDWGDSRGPDGMAIDQAGRLYVTAGLNYVAEPKQVATKFKAAVYVIAPDSGELLETIPVPMDMTTNCAFGGEDLKTLYITAGHKLWSIPVQTPGYVAWLNKK